MILIIFVGIFYSQRRAQKAAEIAAMKIKKHVPSSATAAVTTASHTPHHHSHEYYRQDQVGEDEPMSDNDSNDADSATEGEDDPEAELESEDGEHNHHHSGASIRKPEQRPQGHAEDDREKEVYEEEDDDDNGRRRPVNVANVPRQQKNEPLSPQQHHRLLHPHSRSQPSSLVPTGQLRAHPYPRHLRGDILHHPHHGDRLTTATTQHHRRPRGSSNSHPWYTLSAPTTAATSYQVPLSPGARGTCRGRAEIERDMEVDDVDEGDSKSISAFVGVAPSRSATALRPMSSSSGPGVGIGVRRGSGLADLDTPIGRFVFCQRLY